MGRDDLLGVGDWDRRSPGSEDYALVGERDAIWSSSIIFSDFSSKFVELDFYCLSIVGICPCTSNTSYLFGRGLGARSFSAAVDSLPSGSLMNA